MHVTRETIRDLVAFALNEVPANDPARPLAERRMHEGLAAFAEGRFAFAHAIAYELRSDIAPRLRRGRARVVDFAQDLADLAYHAVLSRAGE